MWRKTKFQLLLLLISYVNCLTLKDALLPDNLIHKRVTREYKDVDKYRTNLSIYDNKSLKPEETHDLPDTLPSGLGKRCARCESYNYNSRYRPDDRGPRDRYDYDFDRRYDRNNRYDRDRYDDYDRYDRYNPRDRYDRDRYDNYDDRYRDRYDYYDRNRGTGYDNRGFDYRDKYSRDRYDRDGYRPLDETYRGSSGFDSAGRGYYYAGGRPDYFGYGGGYASNWNYGEDRDRYGGYRGGDFYRGTSYLYGRPSSSTPAPSTNAVTNSQDNVSGSPTS